MKPGQTVEHEFPYVPGEAGVLRGRFEITHDRFPDDDRYLFAISVAPQIKVLLVNGNPTPDPFQNEALYLRTALTSTTTPEKSPAAKPPRAGDAAAAAREMQRLLQVVEMTEPAVNPESLRDASVVILANCGGLNQQQFAWLRDYVHDGGGLMIFPGDRVNPGVYNSQLLLIPGPAKQKFVAVTMGAPLGDVREVRRVPPAGTDRLHASRVAGVRRPQGPLFCHGQFLSFASRLCSTRRPDAVWPLAGYSAEEPALVEGKYGDGLVLLAAFPATGQWSNLPLKPEFVPLVLRMVNHVKRRAELDAPAVVLPDGLAEITVAAAWSPVAATVTDPAGPQRRACVSAGRQVAGGRLRADHAAGILSRGGERRQARTRRKAATAAFAVNLAPEESQLAAASQEDIRRWLPDVSLRVVDASAEAQQQFGSVGEGTEIWRWLLAIAFVIIAVEFMLSTPSGRPAGGKDDRGSFHWLRRLRPALGGAMDRRARGRRQTFRRRGPEIDRSLRGICHEQHAALGPGADSAIDRSNATIAPVELDDHGMAVVCGAPARVALGRRRRPTC